MTRLYIVRHAWAAEPGGGSDELRPLTPDGHKRFRAFFRQLIGAGMCPAAILTSPLLRCRQTAEIMAAELGGDPPLVQPELAPGAGLAALVRASQSQPDELAWVGHMPDVSRLTAALAGGADANIRFSKGAAAALEFAGPIQPGGGVLLWLATAKLLGV